MVTVRNSSGQVVTVSSPEHCAVIEQLIASGEVERVEVAEPAKVKRTAKPKPAEL